MIDTCIRIFIYKLKDLIEVKDNYRSKLYPKPNEIFSSSDVKEGFIPFIKIASFSNGEIKNKFWITNDKNNSMPAKGIANIDDIFIGVYGTIVLSYNKDYKYARLASGVKILRNLNNGKALNKFIYWKLKNTIKQYSKQGSTLAQINISDILSISIEIPSLKNQQKIIDIIEQREELFLKHSNCVRIDSYNNTKNDMKKLIDIIEPIELLLENIQKNTKTN